MSALRTIAPKKGDLVKGHRVWAILPGDLPAVQGVIIEAGDSTVIMEVSAFLAALGLPRRSRWTWRRSANAYQQAGARTVKGCSLVLDPRPKGERT